MNKYFLVIPVFIVLCLGGVVKAQTIPPYTITSSNLPVPGYFFVNPLKIGPNPAGIKPSLMIIDGKGDVAYIKTFLTGLPVVDFKMHENGLMSYGRQGKFFLMDSTFTVIDTVNCVNGVTSDTHDLKILPNGNFLLLGYETVTANLSSYLLFGPNNAPGSINASIICGVIQELDSNKNLVFEWRAYDHFAFDEIDEAWLIDPNQVDWTHCNSVDVDIDGNILLSSRHFNEITKIDRQTGSIMWRFGGNANQFFFLNDPLNFKRQHDAVWMANGNITLFDNGDGPYQNPYHYASAKEYLLDTVIMTAELVWNYTDDFTEYSHAMGNFQRVQGGNSVVCYGWSAIQNKLFSFVSDTGQELLQFAFDDTLFSYRTFHYDDFPWDLNRPEITCYENGGQYYLDAGPGYSAYTWSNGATSQVIPLTTIGSYHVFVPKGQGGFLKSPNFEVYNMSDPCGLSGIEEHPQAGILVSPNPVRDILQLRFTNVSQSGFPVEIYNASGKLVHSGYPDEPGKYLLNTRNFATGIFVVRYGSLVAKFVKF